MLMLCYLLANLILQSDFEELLVWSFHQRHFSTLVKSTLYQSHHYDSLMTNCQQSNVYKNNINVVEFIGMLLVTVPIALAPKSFLYSKCTHYK